ncbi:uncharacterized protein TNIN_59071 [Trichonephila inaurata madagascariensis]|uniref:Uncharacterized protein n=1 Tax=Trichonephila inaurata madagascariensis TaxID=2747483 RepID=A0A8X7CK40_9ARAC|nr:uncharacterized protein TNIN_59071 [Trichonephila inaurata madagascariensis]
MERETKPAPELLLAQLVLSAVLVLLVGHATYESEYPVPEFRYEVHWGRPVFLEEKARGILIREFRAAYTVLLLLAISSAYFFINLLLYVTLKLMRDPLPLYKTTLVSRRLTPQFWTSKPRGEVSLQPLSFLASTEVADYPFPWTCTHETESISSMVHCLEFRSMCSQQDNRITPDSDGQRSDYC